MRENVVMITDTIDRKFLMTIRTPSAGEKLKVFAWGAGGPWSNLYRGSWETIDKGFLRFQGGDAWRQTNQIVRRGLAPDIANHLLLRLPGGNDVARDNLTDSQQSSSWGLILYDYDRFSRTNDSGTG